LLRAWFWRHQQALGRPDLVAVRRRESAVVAGALVIALVALRSSGTGDRRDRVVAFALVRAGRLRATAFVDVLCQPPGVIADVGLPSSAARSALRAALWVTAALAIRWVAARSGRGPDGVGMVTVMCCCRARWRAGSYGIRSCQQRHRIRHQARPRVRIARGWSCPRARERARA
jgi:hypothetical protein